MECLSCQSTLADDARFCARCGTAVARRDEEPADPLRELLKIALGRQYEVLRLLGRGGMGAVYLARETSLDREVAIKVLPSQQQATPEHRERFRREARTAARLSHPNIVPLHTFGDVDGTMYFVMGYVRGESLAEKLRREGRLEIETSRRILSEIAQALEYAHSLGIVHRDIKPDNVLIEEGTGRAILTDFGVAKPLGTNETLTMQGSLLGTPHYMSPEQASGRTDIDRRSDLYSLGVMGYVMLAGRLPFDGKTTGDILVQHLTVDAPPLHALAPDIPTELSTALMRCLQKEPQKRWHDAAELRTQLLPPEEDDLPQPFGDMRELAAAMVITPILTMYVVAWFGWSGGDPERAAAAMWISAIAMAVPAVVGALKWRGLRKAGYTNRRIAYETLKQPKRYIGWYPRRLRAKGDYYDRLPKELRAARNSLGTFVLTSFGIVVPLWIALMASINNPAFDKTQFPKWILFFMVAGVAPLVTGAVHQFRWRRRLKKAGLYDPELENKIAVTPTAPSSFWSKPAVQRLLEPAEAVNGATTRASAQPASPAEMSKAISSIVSALDFPARELGERARIAARTVVASVAALDEEISALATTIDPSERDRLTVKLHALGADAVTTRLDVREMLQQQLELVEKVETRFQNAKQERAQRVELLKTLWLQVAALRAENETVRASDTIDRVQALCDEIGAQSHAEEKTVLRRAQEQATVIR
jgi:hypothetical protein